MPRFVIFQPPRSSATQIDFENFIELTRGLSVSSAAASSSDSRGPDFLELGLSQAFNLRIEAKADNLLVSLVPTIKSGEFRPVQLEIIGSGETVTAELLQHRLYSLRQIYATAFLLEEHKEKDIAEVLQRKPDADLEQELVAEENKLVIRDASSGSLILTLIATSKKSYQAILSICALPFSEGRKLLLERVAAGTELSKLSVEEKRQDLLIKGVKDIIDIAKQVDSIKNQETRELIRERVFKDMSGLIPADVSKKQQNSITQAHNVSTVLESGHNILEKEKSRDKAKRKTQKKK